MSSYRVITTSTSRSGGPSLINDPFFQGFGMSQGQPDIEGNEWKVEVDVNGFEQEEVHSTVEGNVVEVHALHDKEGNRREVKRQFNVPDGADVDKIAAEINDKGILVITAPHRSPEGNTQCIRTQETQSVPQGDFLSFGKTAPEGNIQCTRTQEIQSVPQGEFLSFGKTAPAGNIQCTRRQEIQNAPQGEFLSFGKMPQSFPTHAYGGHGKDFFTKVIMRNFQPSEIQITAGGGRLKVHAKSKQGISSRLVDRSLDLPSTVNMAELSAILSDDGTLYIGAPLPDNYKGQNVDVNKV